MLTEQQRIVIEQSLTYVYVSVIIVANAAAESGEYKCVSAITVVVIMLALAAQSIAVIIVAAIFSTLTLIAAADLAIIAVSVALISRLIILGISC